MWETCVQSLGWEDSLEKWMATHSSILAWRIPWTEKPGRLHSMGSQRVGHDWVTFAFIVPYCFNYFSFVVKFKNIGEKLNGILGFEKCLLLFIAFYTAWQVVCMYVCVLVTQSCLTLCHPMGCNPPGSSVHGILQARILEWVAIPFSRETSKPRDQTCVS